MGELIEGILALLKEESSILASPDDAAYFRTAIPSLQKPKQKEHIAPLYREGMKKRELEKKDTQIFCSGASSFVPEQSASEEEKFAKLTLSKTDFPITSGIQPDVSKPKVSPSPIIKEKKPTPHAEFSSIMKKVAPTFQILDKLPDDRLAQQLANRYQTKNQSAPISILSCGELEEHQRMLGDIAAAIDVYFGPAKLIDAEPIEKENGWKLFLSSENLKWIVICDSTLWQLNHLRSFYKENPATQTRVIGKTSLFLLPDLSLYLKDPLLKRSLWKAICEKFS